MHFPLTALGFKKNSWIICSDSVFLNGVKVRNLYGAVLSSSFTGCCCEGRNIAAVLCVEYTVVTAWL
jgi:hypothetical protein